MKSIYRAIMLTAVVGLASPLGHAALSTNDAAAVCKSEAQAKYTQGTQAVRVKFKGIYGSATHRKVRLQVLPAEGKAFLALCEVDGNTGAIATLVPSSAPGKTLETVVR